MPITPLFVLSTIESDSHTWNLIYLQRLLEEQGIETVNLGPCVPHSETVAVIGATRPHATVISSVNGHGSTQGQALLRLARTTLGDALPPMVIGGKLAISDGGAQAAREELLQSGYAAVFCGDDAVEEFRGWLLGFRQTLQPTAIACTPSAGIGRPGKRGGRVG
jgi:methylaspartate mutase sigma subunit